MATYIKAKDGSGQVSQSELTLRPYPSVGRVCGIYLNLPALRTSGTIAPALYS